MQEFTLSVESRTNVGTSNCRNLRRQGFVPGIVYSRNEDSIPVVVKYNEFLKLARRAASSQLFTLKSEVQGLNGRIAIIKDVQKDYLNQGSPIHIDFLALREDVEVTMDVNLRVVGEPIGVKVSGGVLSVQVHEISVSCLPKNIPGRVEVDVTNIDLGESLHARDIVLPEGVQLAGEPDETIVSVVMIHVVEEAPAAEAAAPAEGEAAAEGAEGTASASSEESGESKEKKDK